MCVYIYIYIYECICLILILAVSDFVVKLDPEYILQPFHFLLMTPGICMFESCKGGQAKGGHELDAMVQCFVQLYVSCHCTFRSA